MTIDHAEHVPLGRTSLTVSRLGFGGASIGGLFSAVDDASAAETIRHAWSLGVRTFHPIPADLWAELRADGLIAAGASVPAP